MYRIGIDLGGTNIAAGVVDEGQHIVAEVSLPTGAERPAEAVIADICRAAEKAMEKAGITAAHCASVGIGSRGPATAPTAWWCGPITWAGSMCRYAAW